MAGSDPNRSDGQAEPYTHDDPRLEIPEVLRKPSQIPPDPDKRPAVSEGMQMGRALATAMDFVFTILAGAILGWLFDKWRGTNPTGALVGLSLGFVLAFYRIVRATQKQERAEKEAKDRRR